MKEITYSKAINEAYFEEMERDPNVFILGEDIGMHWGGPFGEMRGLYEKYGAERIRETPISETAILGTAIGAAITGMRPVAFLMFVDFVGVCGDEILNALAPMRYMFGGQTKLPVTVVCYSGAGIHNAHTHSKSLEGLLMSIPGLRILSPATPYDAKGLLKTAIRDDNPKIFFINKRLRLTKGQIPEEEYTVPLGKADVKRQGKDVTVVAIGGMVLPALAAAEKLEKEKSISVEVIDTRTVVPLDTQTIYESLKKTGRLVIMDEEPRTGSAAAEIAAIVADEAFDLLDAPIKRVCAPDTAIPFSPPLEQFWMPDEGKLIKAINEIM